MDDNAKIIEGLQTRLVVLEAELKKAKEHERDIEDSRKAMLYILEDLNESKANILRAKEEWEGTFDAISNPIFIHDKDFNIIRANIAYTKAAGAAFKDIIGKPYFKVFPVIDGPFKTCLETQELQEGEDEVVVPVIDKIFRVKSYPVKSADDAKLLYSIHILEDITEQRRIYERIEQEIDINKNLLMISDATAHTTNIDKLMEQVVKCTCKIVGYDLCLSYLWDKNVQVFNPIQACGLEHWTLSLFKTQPLDDKNGFIKRTFEEKGPVAFQKRELPAPFLHFDWIKNISTIVVIPIIGRGERLGLIVNISNTERVITEREIKIMTGIAHQVSTALTEAQLYKDSVDKAMTLSHKIETIQVMHEIDRSIISILETEEILETATQMTARIIPSERITIVLVDNEKNGFIYKAGFGVDLAKGAFVPFESTSTTEVVKTGLPQFTHDLTIEQDIKPLEKIFLEQGYRSHIRVPLIVRGEVVGVFIAGSKKVGNFTPEHLSTMENLAGQIAIALENSRLLTDLKELFIGAVKTLSSAIDAKSSWTAGHSERVTKYAMTIAKEIGMEDKDLRNLELAGLLHDIGKIGTYEAILDKPGKLTDEELHIMRQHPVKGAEILAPIKQLKEIIPAIRHHHEFYDGKGYPDGLKGESIPLMARIMSVADAVDAMTADRPYRKGKSMDTIIEELKKGSGTQFDPKIVEIFLKNPVLVQKA